MVYRFSRILQGDHLGSYSLVNLILGMFIVGTHGLPGIISTTE